jgi:hypothetical protein
MQCLITCAHIATCTIKSCSASSHAHTCTIKSCSASSHAHTCTIAEMHTPAISPIGHYICPCSDTQKRRRSTLTRTCASWRTRAHIYARICERQSLSSSNFLTPPQSRTYRVYVCCGNADRLNVAHPASVYVVTTHALELVEATLTTARAVHILKDVLWVRKLGNLALVQTCKLWAQPRSTARLQQNCRS